MDVNGWSRPTQPQRTLHTDLAGCLCPASLREGDLERRSQIEAWLQSIDGSTLNATPGKEPHDTHACSCPARSQRASSSPPRSTASLADPSSASGDLLPHQQQQLVQSQASVHPQQEHCPQKQQQMVVLLLQSLQQQQCLQPQQQQQYVQALQRHLEQQQQPQQEQEQQHLQEQLQVVLLQLRQHLLQQPQYQHFQQSHQPSSHAHHLAFHSQQ